MDGVLPAGIRAVRDSGNVGQPPEAVAIIHKRFRTFRQRLTCEFGIAMLKSRDERMLQI